MEISPTGTAPELLTQYSALFKRCFPRGSHLDITYLDWLYRLNPAGSVVGFDAWADGRLAAHYVCVPVDAVVDGRVGKVLLSLNTATDPDFQGRGLFTQLAKATYQAGAEHGVMAVYGVANANSTPGFVRKLGFDLVRSLDARVGIGRLCEGDWDAISRASQFRREWSPESLAWRVANPTRPYRLCRISDGRSVGAVASTGRPGVQAWAELPATAAAGMATDASGFGLRLHLGLLPDSVGRRKGVWADVPQRLRPSPLNLIFRPLAQGIVVPAKEAILFGQLDFDAF